MWEMLRSAKFMKFSVHIGIIMFSLGLGGFAYLGFFTRFWLDDWCYNSHFRNLGFFETLKGYHYIVNYASNRFSLTFFNGLFYFLDVLGSQILPLVIILLWSGGLILIFTQLTQLYRIQISRVWLVLCALSIVFYSVYLAPNRFQTVYWRSGALPYTFPILFGLLLTGYILYAANRQRSFVTVTAVVAPLAFLAGGFSEAGGVVLVVWWMWMVFFSCIAKSRGYEWAARMLRLSTIALVFGIFALVALIASPANPLRQIAYGQPSSVLDTVLKSIEYSADFIYSSIKATPLPLFSFSLLFAGVGIQFENSLKPEQYDNTVPLNSYLMVIILLVGYSLILAMHAPSAFIEHVSPAIRTYTISQFILLVMVASCAFFFGRLGSRVIKYRWVPQLAIVAIWVSFIYLGYAEQKVFSRDLPRFQKVASVWDERHELILSEKNKGNLDIEVRAIDSAYLGGILEWYPDPHWVNFCAAEYYGVDVIRATIPW